MIDALDALGFDLFSYSAGLITAGWALMLAAVIAHRSDRPGRRDTPPVETAGRFELLELEAVGCTCVEYVVDYSDPERYHPENLDRELTPGCPEHADGV